MKRITLCSSAKFYTELKLIAEELIKEGYEVLLPSMKDYHELGEDALAKIQYNLIRNHFEKIDKSDAIYVLNLEKNGMKGYIGGNVLMEISHAFYKKIPIYMYQSYSEDLPYKEELRAMQPIIMGKEWNKLNEVTIN